MPLHTHTREEMPAAARPPAGRVCGRAMRRDALAGAGPHSPGPQGPQTMVTRGWIEV